MGIFLYLVSIDNFKAHLAAACAFGFFGTFNFAILLNFGGELIYPDSESTSSSILLMLNNGISVVILEILSLLISEFGLIYGSVFLGVLKLIGIVLLILTKNTLNRQRAENEET